MSTTKIATAAAAVALSVLGLSACTSEDPTIHTPSTTASTSSASASPEPSATPTSSPLPAFQPVPGAALATDDQVAAAKAAGLAVFEDFQGNKVAYAPGQPLPDAVKTAIVAQEQDFIGRLDAKSFAWDSVTHDTEAQARKASDETGRNVAIVYPVLGNTADSWDNAWLWYSTASDDMTVNDQAGAVAKAQAWIAAQPDAANWDLIVMAQPSTDITVRP